MVAARSFLFINVVGGKNSLKMNGAFRAAAIVKPVSHTARSVSMLHHTDSDFPRLCLAHQTMKQNLRCGTPVSCWVLQLDRCDVVPSVFNCCPRELNLFRAI